MLNLILYQSLDRTRNYRSILGSKQKLSKFAPSSTTPEAKNLALNSPSKGIVDQDCLINYAGCEGNSKSAYCRAYFICLIVLQVINFSYSIQASLSSHCIRYNISVLPTAFKMFPQMEKLTPFNYHQWKEDMESFLRTKLLFRLTQEIEAVPILNHDKENYLNRLGEAHGYVSLSDSRCLDFHIQGSKTPK